MVVDPKLFSLSCVPGSRRIDQQTAAAGVSAYTGVPGPVVERLFLGSGVLTRGEGVLDESEPMIWEHDRVLTTAERMKLYYDRAQHLAFQAVGKTLQRADIPADRITHLVTVSCTGFVSPGVDHAIIGKFQLRNDVERVHVGFMGCHAAVNGLRVARALAQTPGAMVLICCVEICGIHLQPSPISENLVGAALFSDGAAAGLISGDAPPGGLSIGSPLSLYLPEGAELMSWKIGDTGFKMHLGSQLPSFLAERLPKSEVGAWLSSAQSVALHPGGGRLLRAVSQSLRLQERDTADALAVLQLFGNMSSPTPLFILERLLLRRAEGPIALLAFGPGLHAEGLMLSRGT